MKQSTLELVVEQIVTDICSGKYQKGQKYLSENTLCQQLSVSRTTVREALRMIQAMGFLELKPGRGAFVSQPEQKDPHQRAIAWISFQKEKLLDITEVRAGLEPVAARYAAIRMTEDELCMLLGIAAMFEHAYEKNNIVGMIQADSKFHTMIAVASHNELLHKLCTQMNETLLDVRTGLFSVKNNGKAAIEEHKTILTALEEHNPIAAFDTMKQHLDHVSENIKEIVRRNQDETTLEQ